MRRRDRTGADTLERTARAASVLDPEVPGPGVAEAIVDDALRTVPTREMFTRSEALQLLHNVATAIDGTADVPEVMAIVDRIDRDTRDQALIPGTDLVNGLLDIRLAGIR